MLSYLLALAVAPAVPLLLLAVLISGHWAEAEQFRLRSVARELTDHAVAQVDQFIAGKVAMLQALATSPAIDMRDFRRVDAQARELLDLQGLNIVLRDVEGQQFVNTRVPWGTPLPRVTNLDADQHVVSSQAPYVTDIYQGRMAGGPLIRIIAPVIRDREVRFTLTASLAPDSLSALLRQAGLGAPYFGSVVDRNGRIIARAQHDETLVGSELPGFAESQGPDGSWSGVNPLGIRVYGTFRRSVVTGWMFTAGVDQALLDAPLHRSLWMLGLVGCGLLAVAAVASLGIFRRIIRAERAIAEAAEALGEGRAVAAPVTPMREMNMVGQALAAASARLRDQAAALTAANQELEHRVEARTREASAQADLIRVTLDNMDQGLMLVEADGTVPICNQRALELLELPAALMESKPRFDDILRYQLGQNDFARSDAPLKTWVESGGLEQVQHTYERERPNGVVLEIRTVPLPTGGAVRTYTDITARKRTETVSHHMARHDGLTELPNRTFFRERLAHALAGLGRKGSAVAVLCIDLDRFKAVNDTLGHPAGDALLKLVADRIRGVTRKEDVIARLGGDEFAIIQLDGDQPRAAGMLARRVIEAIREPFAVAGHVITVGASIGIALAPRDGVEVDAIFRSADLALYRAKAEGRNMHRFFAAEMDVARQARQALELDLRQALNRGEFELHFQPIVGLGDATVSGYEALARWRHPERGTVSPAQFIPLAEETRLIVPLGGWVLQEACRTAATWPDHIRVAVNISAIQIEEGGLVATVLAALAASGLPARRLELEITETVLMHESEVVLRTLNALREFGVRIAFDDFGTGHSSLTYLRQFPLDAVKIDRSFVAGIDDPRTAAILQAITALGRGFGITVTAEGVETAAQLEHVRRAGCTEAQGYLFGRPAPAAAIRERAAGAATGLAA